MGEHDHRTIAVGKSQDIEKQNTISKSLTKQNTITVSKEQVIEYWPGSWFGEVALFASQTYQFTVFVAAFAETLGVVEDPEDNAEGVSDFSLGVPGNVGEC